MKSEIIPRENKEIENVEEEEEEEGEELEEEKEEEMNKNKKCSLIDHEEIDAVIYCQECKIYMP